MQTQIKQIEDLEARLSALEARGELMVVTNTVDGTVNINTALVPVNFDNIAYQRLGFSATLAANVVTMGQDVPAMLVLPKISVFQQTGTRSVMRGEVIVNGTPVAGNDARPHAYIRTMGNDDGGGDMGYTVLTGITSGDTIGVSCIRSTTQTSSARFTGRGCGMTLIALP